MALDLIAFSGPVEVKERSTMTIRARFRDASGFVDVIPTNASYRLDDESGVALTDWTPMPGPMAATLSVVLTGEQNRVLNEARDAERKMITVMANRGLATQFVGSYSYLVRNLGWAD